MHGFCNNIDMNASCIGEYLYTLIIHLQLGEQLLISTPRRVSTLRVRSYLDGEIFMRWN